MSRYDIAIIGTGPAGLSAAITATIRNKKVLLLGNKSLSTKLEKAHTIQNYLGLPAISGEMLAKAFNDHLTAMNIVITEDRVSAVYPMGDYFGLQAGQNMYEATAVILATGVVPANFFPGENELLGKGVSYCATCDAPLYKGKTAIIVAYGAHEEAEANFLAELASKVYYLPMYKGDVTVSDSVEVIHGIPKVIEESGNARILKTSEGDYSADGIFILRESVSPTQLISGIAIEDNRVVVDRLMQTSIPGCFACGDIVGAPYQYIKAAGEGNVAALSAVSYIDKNKKA
ncbi:MAG: NAD(P)/FAD-dependent oxidoreductase [Treponema sp.]|nr:NAD(P)/FAD-dependent oxidoreductase [Treponema sp.]